MPPGAFSYAGGPPPLASVASGGSAMSASHMSGSYMSSHLPPMPQQGSLMAGGGSVYGPSYGSSAMGSGALPPVQQQPPHALSFAPAVMR